ncbi:MAG TPA: hypothetical protein VGH64_06395 [Puia sp.]
MTKAESFLLSECQEEREPPQQDHQYGNGIRLRRFADLEDPHMFAHLCGLPAGRAEIFSELHKMKTAGEKILQHSAVYLVSVSDYKFNKPKVQSLKPKTL